MANRDLPRATRQSVRVVTFTPTIDATAVATGDVVTDGIATFAGMHVNSGGSGRITKIVITDSAVQSIAGELWLFTTAVTPAAANAAHSISDAHALDCIGVIPIAIADFKASALNSVATISVAANNLPFAYQCVDTTLYGIYVIRGTATYGTTTALQIKMFLTLD